MYKIYILSIFRNIRRKLHMYIHYICNYSKDTVNLTNEYFLDKMFCDNNYF